MLRVAVVGSGPAGVYAADALLRAEAAGELPGGLAVDVLDRLPAPYGLVRYGVAPDHFKIKKIAKALERVLDADAVRFLGCVELGRHLTLEELHRHYDAVVVASGAAVDRRLGVPGEDLPGSVSATSFVAWYSGHPDATLPDGLLDARQVAVVGVGNVAVDVARILVKTPDELRATDVPDAVLDVLAASRVEEVTVLGRRGPVQATWTTKELRELGELPDVDVVVRPGELALDEASRAAVEADAALRRNLETLREWAERPQRGAARRLSVRFLLQPVALLGEERVSAVRCERTELDGTGRVRGTGELTEVPAALVLRSVGYRGVALPGLPFDEARGVVPSVGGRVEGPTGPVPGTYVAGWIKRGATGVVGTNRSDAAETVASLLADAREGRLPRAPERDPGAVLAELRTAGADVVTWDGWRSIDAAERALGVPRGGERVKLAHWEQLRAASHAAPPPPPGAGAPPAPAARPAEGAGGSGTAGDVRRRAPARVG